MASRTGVSELVIPRGSVGKLGRELGRGGQARVYLAPGLALPDAPGQLVYKEYKESSRPPAGGLRALVDKRNRLDAATRAKLDACACWPLRVVEDRGVVMGVMLRLIPPGFIQERVLPHTKVRKQSVREVQHLIVEPEMTRRFGMQCPTPEQRLVICRDFAAAVHRVHRMELVIGDINARNALYRVPDRPSVMLLDCDAARIVGSAAVVAQLNAPDWDPPEGPFALNQSTDRYKLGLFVLRCLAPGKLSSLDRDPARTAAVLDAQGLALLRAALGRVAGDRPTAQVWGRYLNQRIGGPQPIPPQRQAPRVGRPLKGGRRRDANGVWQPVD